MRRRLILSLVAVAILLIVGGFGFTWWIESWWAAPGPLKNPVTLVVVKGGVKAIGRQLDAAGIIDRPLLFDLAARIGGEAASLKAGEYTFPAGVTPKVVAELLAVGHTVVHRIVLPEGWTSSEAIAIVQAAPVLSGQITRAPSEGRLLPETYFYSYGDDRQALIDRMARAMSHTLDELWAARTPHLPLRSPGEALTLASIVEKETAIPAERPKVAAVFYNRLRRGMPLQSDPTVSYALTQGQHLLERPVTHADLAIKSPYNTYVISGLPPGPIANPGKATLLAVLHPATIDALYFVADGSGGHSFATTIGQHNRNVEQWRKLQIQAERRTPPTVLTAPAKH